MKVRLYTRTTNNGSYSDALIKLVSITLGVGLHRRFKKPVILEIARICYDLQ